MTPAEDKRAYDAYEDGRAAFGAGRERKAPSPVPCRGYSGWWYLGWDSARLDAMERDAALGPERETTGQAGEGEGR